MFIEFYMLNITSKTQLIVIISMCDAFFIRNQEAQKKKNIQMHLYIRFLALKIIHKPGIILTIV